MAIKRTVAVIGGGIAGCFCALMLARKGYDVTLIEKEKALGGLFTVFKRKNSLFDVGFHYAGALQKGQFLFESLNKLNLLFENDIEPTDVIDTVHVAGEAYPIGGGIAAFSKVLKIKFPNEAKIDAFMQLVIQNAVDFYRSDEPENMIMNIETVDDVLDRYFENDTIKAVIKYISYLYGADSGEGQFNLHALLLHDIIESPATIKGGSGTLMTHVKVQLEQYGVHIMTGSLVQQIVSDESGRVFTSLQLSNGDRVTADCCISTIHPSLIPKMLTGSSKPEKRLIDKIKSKANGYSGFSAYLRYKGELQSNHYYFDDHLVAEIGILAGEKSGEFQSVTTFIRTDWDEWQAVEGDKAAVSHLKKTYEDRTMALLKKYMPESVSHFEILDSASPLTYVRYTGTVEGSYYGLKCSAAEKGLYSLLPSTKLKGLFIGGQSLFYPGLMGCYCSSRVVSDIVENFLRESG